MKTPRHWLHILLVVLTGGLWLVPYVAILATTEMYNRGYKIGKAAGRVARQNEIDEVQRERFVRQQHAKPRIDRFAELCDKRRTRELEPHEVLELEQLREALSKS